MLIGRIIELDNVVAYLKKHNLTKQYVRATSYLLVGNIEATNFKKRKPKQDGMWQFRITKKYRAYCYRDVDTLVVFEINDHQ
ncbi:MAG: hypothetical protein Q8P93_01230 [bacterium]|nr:hypothetical protein [bacterium]